MREKKVANRLTLAGVLLLGCLALVSLRATASSAPPSDVEDRVNAVLGLKSSSVVSLDFDRDSDRPVTVSLPIAGQSHQLELEPSSARADGYRVLAQLADGSLVEVEPGPEVTFRGRVAGVEHSRVAASMDEDGLHARVFLSQDEQYAVEPLAGRVTGVGRNEHVVYPTDAPITDGFEYGEDFLPNPEALRAALAAASSNCGTTENCVAELAVDADFEYFTDYGSVAAVENRVHSVINTVNVQFESEVSITHLISALIVRTAEPDPYTSTDANTLLNQFRNHWLTNHGDIQRDTAQLFTGKAINGGTIGIAWLDAICTDFGFSVVESDFNGAFSCATDLSAHELGHNWGADHCNCTSNTMNPYITCANTFHPILSIPEMVDFRDSRTCLEPEGSGGVCSSDAECDDGNSCTIDGCDIVSGCFHDVITPCCGNGACEDGEDCGSCSADCFASNGGICGDGVCEGNGEDCFSCPGDCHCSGGQSCEGCCGDGVCGGKGENANNCQADCDPGFVPPAASSCCGDGACENGEEPCTCSTDCGPPPTTEAICTDGVDDDCDGQIDCDDDDCADDPDCPSTVCGNSICEGDGEDCVTCPADCRCTGKDCGNSCCGDGFCVKENAGNCPVDCGG